MANTPKIRFKNFSDEWAEKKFGEIFKYERPDRFIVKNDEYDEKANTPVLTANKAFILGYTNENNTYNNESIIFDDFTLDCKYVDFPYMVKSSAIKILTIKNKEENNLKFAFENLNSTKFEVMGHARHYIAFIQNTATFVPNLAEQCKISEFFAKLDKLIALHQSKFEKLQKIKKSCLQNLFPQNNQNTPKIRFKNFSDEWAEKKFGEIFKYERPDRFIVKNDEYDEKANTPVLTANKAFILGYTNENNTYNNESIIFDDFTLDCKYVDFPYMVKSSAIKILTIKNKEENNLKFAFENLNSTKFEVMGHARHYIAFIQNTATFVPNLAEQCKISEFFAKLDKLIALHQSKFEKLQKIKKSCLQNMFV